MKKFTLIPVMAAMLSAAASFSQTKKSECSIYANRTLAKDSIAALTSFKAAYISGKVYLKWTIANQHVDGIYVIYRSDDGINYESIGSKTGIGVPISKDIAYFFTDNMPLYTASYYKILHISMENTFLMSDKISIASENNLSAANSLFMYK